jgi:hypothetical protein
MINNSWSFCLYPPLIVSYLICDKTHTTTFCDDCDEMNHIKRCSICGTRSLEYYFPNDIDNIASLCDYCMRRCDVDGICDKVDKSMITKLINVPKLNNYNVSNLDTFINIVKIIDIAFHKSSHLSQYLLPEILEIIKELLMRFNYPPLSFWFARGSSKNIAVKKTEINEKYCKKYNINNILDKYNKKGFLYVYDVSHMIGSHSPLYWLITNNEEKMKSMLESC